VNLAILHYHLNRGGVTRVIENQLTAIDAVLDGSEPWQAALLYGGRREGFRRELPGQLRSTRLSLHEAPLLDYDDAHHQGAGENDEALHGQLTAALDRLGFAPAETLLHVHNHSLGKNRHLPAAVVRLAVDGYAVVLQIHDFAEDFRAGNYRQLGETEMLYPQATNVHYAAINGRDYEILAEAGVPAGQLHLLPNPVPPADRRPSRRDARQRLAGRFGIEPEDRFALYPVRCIRRKNVGEVLLCGALAPPGMVFGLTLPPLNPAEVPVHEGWKRLAAELELPCRFELGAPGGLSFAENLAAADLILTTSLAEGFGMVFLESWLAGLPLVGRDLPEITSDFTAAGLRFDWLSPQLRVPVAWVGTEAFRDRVTGAYRHTLDAYGRPQPPDPDRLMSGRVADGLVDFGDLDEPMQREVIRTVCQGKKQRRAVLDHNSWLEEALTIGGEHARAAIEHNARTIDRHYGLEAIGRRLLELYARAAASPRGEKPQPLASAGHILDRFLDPGRFRLIRS